MLRLLVTTVASQKKPRLIIYNQRGNQSVKGLMKHYAHVLIKLFAIYFH